MIPINPIKDTMTIMFWSGKLFVSNSWTGARSVGLTDPAESDVSAGGERKDPALRSTSAFIKSTAMAATKSTTNNLPLMFIRECIHLPKPAIIHYNN